MSSPRRRPLRRDDLDVEVTLRRAASVAPEIELGWSVLRQEMREGGWPSRTPEHDVSPATGPQSALSEPSGIDYADPAGEMAVRFSDLAGELEALQDHWHLVATSLRAMAVIARKHIPNGGPRTVPACSVTTCDEVVEQTSSGYRGMEQIAGIWVARPGVRPLCAKHRSRERRDPRANVD